MTNSTSMRVEHGNAFDWNLFSKVVDGVVMREILIALRVREKTQRMLSFETQNHQSSVQKSLKRLVEYSIVQCRSPDARRSKFYGLTNKGLLYASKLAGWLSEEQRLLEKLHQNTFKADRLRTDRISRGETRA